MPARWNYADLTPAQRERIDTALGKTRSAAKSKRRKPTATELRYQVRLLARDDIALIYFEGLTFHLANGHRYRPDWIVIRHDGCVECHECKGNYQLPSRQRSRLAFDQAQIEYPSFVWVWSEP